MIAIPTPLLDHLPDFKELLFAHTSVKIAGCYSDLNTTGGGELIVGSGTVIIKKDKDRYSGTFQQLKDDGGEGYKKMTLEDLKISEADRTISFRVKLFYLDEKGNQAERMSKATGRFSSRGLKLFWKDDVLIYGQPNPLMTRRNDCEE